MTYPSRIIGWPRFIHPGWKIMLDAGRFPFYSARFTADAPGLYTDTSLTVPVTSYGDAVAGWRGAGLIGVQPTLTARPAYGRMPVSGVVNLLSWSEDITNAAWTKIFSATPDFETLVPNNGVALINAALRQQISKSATSMQVSFQLIVEDDGFNTCEVWIRDTASSSNRASVNFGLATGSINSSAAVGTFSGVAANVTNLGDGRMQVELTCTTGTETSLFAQVFALDSVATTGNGTDGIKVTKLQLNQGPVADYQRVAARYDVTESGVPDTPILYYDLGDDVLPAAMELPEVSGGTLVIAGEKGIWIDDDFSHAGGSWSLGPTTYTGGPAGLLPSLIGNRVLGFAVFAGQLSPEQLQVEVAYWMGKGAQGVWEAGGELVTNGDFATDTVWTKGDGWSITGGQAVRVPAAVGSDISQSIAITGGSYYLSSFALTHNSGNFIARLVAPATNGQLCGSTAVWRDVLLAQTGQSSFILRGAASGADGSIDNASLKPLTLNTDPYP